MANLKPSTSDASRGDGYPCTGGSVEEEWNVRKFFKIRPAKPAGLDADPSQNFGAPVL
jgi:hypothetical protein